jgi:hypothetical protein
MRGALAFVGPPRVATFVALPVVGNLGRALRFKGFSRLDHDDLADLWEAALLRCRGSSTRDDATSSSRHDRGGRCMHLTGLQKRQSPV